MRKSMMILSLVATAAAIPALAMHHGDGKMMDHSKPITRAQVETMVKTRFQEADANKDGVVTSAEHDAVRAARRQAMHDAKFARMDGDKNGQISKAEFDSFHAARADAMADRKGMKAERGGKHGHHMGRGFTTMDANKDGQLTLEESLARPLAMFDRADSNKDGTVTPEEHRAMMDGMRHGHGMKRGGGMMQDGNAPQPAPAPQK